MDSGGLHDVGRADLLMLIDARNSGRLFLFGIV